MSVTITIENMRAAIEALQSLQGRIETQRNRVMSGTPVALPTLQDGAALARASSWLEEQLPDLQMVLDIGILLESEGTGVATLDIDDLALDDADTLLGTELGKRIGDDDLEFRTPEDRERFELYTQLLGDVAKDRDATEALMEETGPAGPTGAMYRMMEAMNNPDPTHSYWIGWEYSGEADEDYDSQDERQKFEDMAALFAENSALLVANGSRNGAIPADGGQAMFESGGPLMSTILLKTANDKGYEFGGDFLGSMGAGMADWERGSSTRYIEENLDDSYWPGMGTGSSKDTDYSPMEELLDAGDRSVQTRQGLAGNEDFLKYMTVDRENEGMEGVGPDHFDDILQRATVEVATDPSYSRNAAEISSNLVQIAGSNEIGDVYDDELGGVVATYIQDAERVVDASDATPGGIHYADGGVPPYGIDMSQDDLRGALKNVGDSDIAVSAIGDAAMRLNQVNLDEGANHLLNGPGPGEAWDRATGDPFLTSVRDAASFRGFMEDAMVNGRIDDAESEAEARKQVAEFFTMPLDLIPTDKAPLIGDYVMGQVKDQIVESYVGDGVPNAISDGKDHLDMGRQTTQLQALAAILNAHTDGEPYADLSPQMIEADPDGGTRFSADQLRQLWGSSGGPGDLSDQQIAHILQGADEMLGLPSEATQWVVTDYGSRYEEHSGNS